MNEIVIYENDKIVLIEKNKVRKEKFTPNYLSKKYTPYKGNKHTIQSITKSIVSLLFGIAIQNNHFPISKLNCYIEEYFVNYKLNPKIKLFHLLSMKSGINWNTNYEDPNNSTFLMEKSNNWIDFIMKQGMINKPGKVFHYADCDTVLLGHIFHKLTNMDISKYANKFLFTPLNIRVFWNRVNGKPDPEGGIYMSSSSLLEIGKLILHRGKYNKKQIINPEYFTKMIKNTRTKNDFWGYGFQWWLRDGFILGWGYKGQYLAIHLKTKKIGILFQWNNQPEIQPFDFIEQIKYLNIK